MSLFTPLTITHFICSLIITIKVKLQWVSMSKICTPLVGCDPPIYRNICISEAVTCVGSLRCCQYCNISHFQNSLQNQSHIEFSDTIFYPIYISLVGVVFILLLNILLFFLLKFTYHPKHKFLRLKSIPLKATLCLILVLIILSSVIFFPLSISLVFSNIHFIKQCQPAFILQVSWCWVLLLWLIQSLADVLPSGLFQNTHHKSKYMYSFIKICLFPISLLINFMRIIGLLWWILISIYFIGLSYKKWKI